jgi:hypothetical protein
MKVIRYTSWIMRLHQWLITSLCARGQAFRLIYYLKWLIVITILLILILALPPQVMEVYRIYYSDPEQRIVNIVRLLMPLVFLSIVLWLCAATLLAEYLESIRVALPSTFYLARILPALLAAIPLIACAVGHLLALPGALPEAPPGSPWENTAAELTSELKDTLPWGACVWIILAIACFVSGYLLFSKMEDKLFGRLRHWCMRPISLIILVTIILLMVFADLKSRVWLPRALDVFSLFSLFFIILSVFTTILSIWSVRYRLPLIPIMLVVAILASAFDLNDNHYIRLEKETLNSQPPLVASEQFLRWYAARPDLTRFKEKYPVYIVSAQGGGLYTAYQTAVFLARMQDICPRFRDHLFAVSSVSGGSLGAATFAAALPLVVSNSSSNNTAPGHGGTQNKGRDIDRSSENYPACNTSMAIHPPTGPIEKSVKHALSQDFLSPLMAASLFPDFLQRFIVPGIPILDRARALEASFETAFPKGTGQNDNILRKPYLSHWNPTESSPALIMNATDVGSGRRFLISPFRLKSLGNADEGRDTTLYFPFWPEKRPPNLEDAAQPSSDILAGHELHDLRLSTAIGVSARFPWVTPAASFTAFDGKRGDIELRLVDGGYVDNSGVETALDLIHVLESAVDTLKEGAKSNKPLPKVVLIMLSGGGFPQPSWYGLGDSLDPIRALLSTRETRAYVALNRAEEHPPSTGLVGIKGLDQYKLVLNNRRLVLLSNRYYDLPLGWLLSARTRSIIELQSGHYWDCLPNLHFEQTDTTLSKADCVQQLVSYDLDERLEDAARLATIFNYRTSARSNKYTDFEKCYRTQLGISPSLLQFRSIEALLDEWNQHTDLHQDAGWLAYALATARVETGDLLPQYEAVRQPPYGPRGFIGLEGRGNYTRVGAGIHTDLDTYPDLALNPEISAQMLFYFLFLSPDGNRLAKYINHEKSDFVGARFVVTKIPIEHDNSAEKIATIAEKLTPCVQAIGH